MLAFKIIWQDEHMVQLRASASNTQYAGEVDVYCTYAQLTSIANKLRGFPRRPGDSLTLELTDPPGEHWRLELTTSATGAVTGVVSFASASLQGEASFQVPAEANLIDRFVLSLEEMVESEGGRAVLGAE